MYWDLFLFGRICLSLFATSSGTYEHILGAMAQSETGKRKEWVIIGISGVTCGGKTTLADQLDKALFPVYVINQDKYFYPDDSPNHTKCKGLNHNNYDILSALDIEAMYNDIMNIIQVNNTNRDSCTDKEGRFELKGKKFLVMEGSILLNYKPILELCDLRYYFVLDYGECMSRRVLQLYDPPDVHGYFEQCVWPQHLKYRREIEKDHRIRILDGRETNPFAIVMADLRTLRNM